MIAESEIRKQIAGFLANQISLDDFEDWIAQRSWDAHQDSDAAAQELAYAIELRLAEHSSGHLSEVELRHELTQFVQQYSLRVSFGSAASMDSYSFQASNSIAVPPVQSAGILCVAERA